MRRQYRPLFVGIALLILSIGLDELGVVLSSLPVLVISFACGIAGAVVAIRGVLEFVSERL